MLIRLLTAATRACLSASSRGICLIGRDDNEPRVCVSESQVHIRPSSKMRGTRTVRVRTQIRSESEEMGRSNPGIDTSASQTINVGM